MKLTLSLALLTFSSLTFAQAWKTLPKGVRILGYRNVTTSTIKSNFNKFGSETTMSPEFKIDGVLLNDITKGAVKSSFSDQMYRDLMVGEYKVDANAHAKVHGLGFGYGITDSLMFYAEIAYYNFNSRARIKRTRGNNYAEMARSLRGTNNPQYINEAQIYEKMMDVNEHNVQSVVTDYFGYKPVGDWQGTGYGDMETGFMIKAVDRGTWGIQVYPGVILPTGRQDDPDMLQDTAFGDGQYDVFGEVATGYVVNDRLSLGTTLRYTYQAPTTKEMRIPEEKDFPLSQDKGSFDVKYGDKFNLMVNAPFIINDWFSVIPFYRFMYQMPSEYTSEFTEADGYLEYNSDKMEHQAQITFSLSSVQPFLKKKFVLPAQINMNLVQTVGGKNVPKMGRFELELRMIF